MPDEWSGKYTVDKDELHLTIEGDTPLLWFKKNKEYMESDPEKYMSEGPALSGVFEVGIKGNHVERFFGSYWWD